MSTVKEITRRVYWEQKMYRRNPPAAAFTFAFPLMFLVIFTALQGNHRVPAHGHHTIRFAQYYVPAIIGFGLISACYTNLAMTVSIRREKGLLKRVRSTPLSPGTYLAGMIGNSVIISAVLTALTTALGLLAYSVTFPGRYLALIVTIATAAFCFSALGIAISTFVPNEDAAPAIVNFVLFPLLFISGTFGDVNDHSAIAHIAGVFPIRYLNKAMVDVFDPFVHGTGLVWRNIGMLVLWGIVGLLVAVRRFRWE